ncbi:GT-D fold domain-containing glycosyltransferase [Gillisia hiemivivida]|uniref:DUF1792 domain-containing protein n=1 Tax=Gillisia hiemivivida TaxID=291190 RepID=A0A5C6ZST1_9FLAO|nr:GT-D fold domain-containing glycosyltransferase [Gillisia hiemivivida]TXD93883.1 DUF1792 domain-containing protein [Gillisia hiemivivida]
MGKEYINKIKFNIKKCFTKKFFKGDTELIVKNILFKNYFDTIKIQTTYDTLDEIEECIERQRGGAYFRFGDGDVFLMELKNDSFQNANRKLSIEISEAFGLAGKNIFKTLPIHSNLFGYDNGMFNGNHKNEDHFAKQLLYATFPYFIGHKIYSPVALHFIATNKVHRANSFLKVLKANTKVFVGNKNFTSKSIELLFGDSIHIKTPSTNAYSEIDRIHNESTEAIDKISHCVVCIAMGCSGRALMKRLHHYTRSKNVFLFDFGSLLDGVNGNDSRTWLKVNEINYDELTGNL